MVLAGMAITEDMIRHMSQDSEGVIVLAYESGTL